jgi:hypothetical protein
MNFNFPNGDIDIKTDENLKYPINKNEELIASLVAIDDLLKDIQKEKNNE